MTSADTVASLHGIGNAPVVKVDNSGCLRLSNIGDVPAEIKYADAQATKFTSAARGNVSESCNSVQNADSKCGVQNKEEWCNISETLFHSTQQ